MDTTEDHNEYAARKANATRAAYLGDRRARTQESLKTHFGPQIRLRDARAWADSLEDGLGSDENVKSLDRACYRKHACTKTIPATLYENKQHLLMFAGIAAGTSRRLTRAELTSAYGLSESSQKRHEKELARQLGWKQGASGGEDAPEFLARQKPEELRERIAEMDICQPGRRPLLNDATTATAMVYADLASESGVPTSRKNLMGLLRSLGRSVAGATDDAKERERRLAAKFGRKWQTRARKVAEVLAGGQTAQQRHVLRDPLCRV